MSVWHEEADVVVVGSGLAGLAAAIEARCAGAHVTVLEKIRIAGREAAALSVRTALHDDRADPGRLANC
jgi:succinate dehydrogenase/fumarate reductase flavoprotein subunit